MLLDPSNNASLRPQFGKLRDHAMSAHPQGGQKDINRALTAALQQQQRHSAELEQRLEQQRALFAARIEQLEADGRQEAQRAADAQRKRSAALLERLDALELAQQAREREDQSARSMGASAAAMGGSTAAAAAAASIGTSARLSSWDDRELQRGLVELAARLEAKFDRKLQAHREAAAEAQAKARALEAQVAELQTAADGQRRVGARVAALERSNAALRKEHEVALPQLGAAARESRRVLDELAGSRVPDLERRLDAALGDGGEGAGGGGALVGAGAAAGAAAASAARLDVVAATVERNAAQQRALWQGAHSAQEEALRALERSLRGELADTAAGVRGQVRQLEGVQQEGARALAADSRELLAAQQKLEQERDGHFELLEERMQRQLAEQRGSAARHEEAILALESKLEESLSSAAAAAEREERWDATRAAASAAQQGRIESLGRQQREGALVAAALGSRVAELETQRGSDERCMRSLAGVPAALEELRGATDFRTAALEQSSMAHDALLDEIGAATRAQAASIERCDAQADDLRCGLEKGVAELALLRSSIGVDLSACQYSVQACLSATKAMEDGEEGRAALFQRCDALRVGSERELGAMRAEVQALTVARAELQALVDSGAAQGAATAALEASQQEGLAAVRAEVQVLVAAGANGREGATASSAALIALRGELAALAAAGKRHEKTVEELASKCAELPSVRGEVQALSAATKRQEQTAEDLTSKCAELPSVRGEVQALAEAGKRQEGLLDGLATKLAALSMSQTQASPAARAPSSNTARARSAPSPPQHTRPATESDTSEDDDADLISDDEDKRHEADDTRHLAVAAPTPTPTQHGRHGRKLSASKILSQVRAAKTQDARVRGPKYNARSKALEFEASFKAGITLKKHGRSGKPKAKRIYLTDDSLQVCWGKSTRTQLRCLHTDEIRSVEPGKHTEVLLRKDVRDVQDDVCFSLVADDRTLDLQCDSVSQRDALVEGFSALLFSEPVVAPPPKLAPKRGKSAFSA